MSFRYSKRPFFDSRQVSGLLLDLDPSVNVSFDKNGNVFSVADRWNNGIVYSQVALANNPPIVQNAINGWPAFNPGGTHYLNGNTAAGTVFGSNTAITLYCVYETNIKNSQYLYTVFGGPDTTNPIFSLGKAVDTAYNVIGSHLINGKTAGGGVVQQASSHLMQPDHMILTVAQDWTNNTHAQYINGVKAYSAPLGISLAGYTGSKTSVLFSGTNGLVPYTGRIARLIVYSGVHTQAQREAVLNGLSKQYNKPIFTSGTTRLVQMQGDSITQGWAVTVNTGYNEYASLPFRTWLALGAKYSDHVANFGWANGRVSGMNTERPNIIDTQSISGLSKGIYFFYGGINDIANGGITGSAAYNLLKTGFQAAQAARPGIKVILATPIDLFNASSTVVTECGNLRNAIIANAINDGADAVCDFGGLSQFAFGTGAYANTTYYYSDGVHPTALGTSIMATLAATTINSV